MFELSVFPWIPELRTQPKVFEAQQQTARLRLIPVTTTVDRVDNGTCLDLFGVFSPSLLYYLDLKYTISSPCLSNPV